MDDMDDMDDTGDHYEGEGILTPFKNLLLSPVHILTSRPALRTYLRTILVLLTSLALLAASIIAYLSFYYTYIPQRGLSIPIHLQFDSSTPSKHPYGVAQIGAYGTLASRQRYDVSVAIDMPRTEGNVGVGNWMVEVVLRGPDESRSILGALPKMMGGDEDEVWDMDGSTATQGTEKAGAPNTATSVGVGDKVVVLARSRRPAILTYRSRIVELAYRLTRLPLYLVGWGQEAERVEVGMMEGVEFEKGWRNLPASLRLEVRSREVLQIYKVEVRFAARFEGLRYIMYNHRIFSFLAFTTSFYSVSMTLLFLTWGILSFLFSPSRSTSATTKSEPRTPIDPKLDQDSEPATPLSDSSRTFPTLSRHAPLYYPSSSGKVKDESKEEDEHRRLEDMPRPEGDADDEDDEDADFMLEETGLGLGHDSGLGTSMESSVERARKGVRRRTSGGLGKDG